MPVLVSALAIPDADRLVHGRGGLAAARSRRQPSRRGGLSAEPACPLRRPPGRSTAPAQRLPGSDTELWISSLKELETSLATPARRPRLRHLGRPGTDDPPPTVPHRDPPPGRPYHICQGGTDADLKEWVRIPSDYQVWMPYDNPTAADIDHLYSELTVPSAPFGSHVPDASDPRPHALVLIGDMPHEPGHLEEGLRPVFEATGVIPHFARSTSGHSRPRTSPRSSSWSSSAKASCGTSKPHARRSVG